MSHFKLNIIVRIAQDKYEVELCLENLTENERNIANLSVDENIFLTVFNVSLKQIYHS